MSSTGDSGGRVNKFFPILVLVFGLLTAVTGIYFLIGGWKLAALGGSLYYIIAGIAYLLLLVLLVLKKRPGLTLSIVIFVATAIWALIEVGGVAYWPLMARLVVPAIILMLSLWVFPALAKEISSSKRAAHLSGWGVFVCLLGVLAGAFVPHGKIYNPAAVATQPAALEGDYKAQADQDWDHLSRNASGTRFAAVDQITPENVNKLQVAWTYRTGRILEGKVAGVDENTPLQIGNVLYTCTPQNVVAAVDADTGKPIWKVDPKAAATSHVTCRSVGYYDLDKDTSLSSEEKAQAPAECRRRIIATTIDARMLALDAQTGQACTGFGNAGTVDLRAGMTPTENGQAYHPSGTPVIMGHLTVFGTWIHDHSDNDASGVVRAYDVRNGALVWSWNAEEDAPDAVNHTGGTPNVWAPATYDRDLNMVYLPTGMGPPDYWGGKRTPSAEKFSSAVVAVDATTGKTKWIFQTVHHDVWDYDVPSQPVMYEMKNEEGESVPVLIQTTKMGQIFVLDRRTGKPASKVEELPVTTTPTGQDDHMSPTQPFSTNMPSLGLSTLKESEMWGITPFDQLECRITFKSARYNGIYTPSAESDYIQFPGTLGGMNWGGISIDERNGMMYVNDIRMGKVMALKTEEQAKTYKGSPIRSMLAKPYVGLKSDFFMSSLGVPCQNPPFGTLSAIDLNTKKLVWQVPVGTVEDTGPLGMKTHLPMPIGMPTLGGPTATAGGVVFFAGTQDNYMRAFNSKTGEEIWKYRLPVGATASPLVYKSPQTGKQYVVISAGGAAHAAELGDYLIAFALPDSQK